MSFSKFRYYPGVDEISDALLIYDINTDDIIAIEYPEVWNILRRLDKQYNREQLEKIITKTFNNTPLAANVADEIIDDLIKNNLLVP